MNKAQQPPHDLYQRLRLLDILDQITQVSLGSENMAEVMRGVLDLILEVFNADRAWFLYPCDPDAPCWKVPLERTRPKWPGLFAQGVDMPMNSSMAEIYSELLRAPGTIQYGPATGHPVPPLVIEHFSVKSQLMIALRPKIGNAWVFGLHHCESAVLHNEEDMHIFTAIAHRISDTLSVLITTKQLSESEAKFRTLYDSTSDAVMLLDAEGFIDCNKATLAIFGCASLAEFCSRHPADFSPPEQPCGTDSISLANQHITTAMEQGSHRFEWVHKRSDTDASFPAEVLLNVMELDGKTVLQATVRDITERKRAEAEMLHLMAVSKRNEIELREHQQLLRELAAQDVKTREADYKHIAREVHDELGQTLTALRMDASLLRIQFGEINPVLKKKIQDMLLLVDKAIQGVRDVTANLRPPALDMGLVPAIAWLCDEFPERTTTACTLRIVDDPVGLDDARTVAIFRIVQESLTNVARYAAASRVDITIRHGANDIAIEVRDDGKGFDPAALPAHKSFGLLGMRERALALGGMVEIDSAPAQGTIVSVRIPITFEEDVL